MPSASDESSQWKGHWSKDLIWASSAHAQTQDPKGKGAGAVSALGSEELGTHCRAPDQRNTGSKISFHPTQQAAPSMPCASRDQTLNRSSYQFPFDESLSRPKDSDTPASGIKPVIQGPRAGWRINGVGETGEVVPGSDRRQSDKNRLTRC
jgi:hypothetical protein